ncbi:hypothetical protein Pan153_39880 [Gimesia panareensis]|uniref:Lipoprotein n=1 Tax=Gimesia panareensis TaxID=2527978 RepID=A0A518FSM1_9PLAN|nr:hypothetical protein [Gimesia panareensis]QDV19323.1 hypothetical protein Pan153_39880 [Gimesia panareensis]
MRFVLVSCLLFSLLLAGCTSFKTMTLGRLDSDSLFVECFGHKQKGVPVKLKVPTHVVVSIYEQQVLIRGNDGVKLQSFSPPQFEVESKLAYTDKVFLVDFVRPAGGSLTLGENRTEGISFDDDQYFKTIQAKVTEQTMHQVGAALDTVKGALTGSDTQEKGGVVKTVGDTSNLKFEKSIIACQRFDLARPHWEEEVNAFVEDYIGECTICPVPSNQAVSPGQNLPPSPQPKEVDQIIPAPARKQVGLRFSPEAPPALELLE